MITIKSTVLLNTENKNRGKARMHQVPGKTVPALVLWVTIMFGAFQTTQAQQKPGWLNNYPANPLYYIGIAGIEKEPGDLDYKNKAREFALSELISQIEVIVSSSTETLETEINGDYENSYAAFVQLQAQKTIEDYEIVDAWENNEEYWVYVRLSKQKYNARLLQKVEAAKNQAYAALQSGREEVSKGNYASALSSFVKALGDVSPYIDRLTPIVENARPVNLFGELRSAIQSTLDQITITETSGPQEAQVGKAGEVPFSLKAADKRTGSPLQGIPLRFYFIRGEGEIEKNVATNSEGAVTAQLSKVTAQDNMQIVSADIELARFLNEEASNDFIKNLLGSFNSPSARYVLKVRGVPVYLEHNEMYLGEETTTNYIEPVIKNYFTKEGFTFIDDLGEAELYVELSANARQGSEIYGIYSAFVDYRIVVTSLVTGEELAAYSQTDIKGMSDNYQKAAAKAYEASIDSLQTHFVQLLISQIQK